MVAIGSLGPLKSRAGDHGIDQGCGSDDTAASFPAAAKLVLHNERLRCAFHVAIFDIFDTLISRVYATPEDVHWHLAELLAEAGLIADHPLAFGRGTPAGRGSSLGASW
jgi:hypothetical protein